VWGGERKTSGRGLISIDRLGWVGGWLCDRSLRDLAVVLHMPCINPPSSPLTSYIEGGNAGNRTAGLLCVLLSSDHPIPRYYPSQTNAMRGDRLGKRRTTSPALNTSVGWQEC